MTTTNTINSNRVVSEENNLKHISYYLKNGTHHSDVLGMKFKVRRRSIARAAKNYLLQGKSDNERAQKRFSFSYDIF